MRPPQQSDAPPMRGRSFINIGGGPARPSRARARARPFAPNFLWPENPASDFAVLIRGKKRLNNDWPRVRLEPCRSGAKAVLMPLAPDPLPPGAPLGKLPPEVLQFFHNPGGHSLLIRGPAGTGKTTPALQLLETLYGFERNFYLSSR